MRSGHGVQVQIFGQVYHVRSGEDPERVRKVARLVDETMGRIADKGRTADSYRVAVLAALELADELTGLREQHERYRSSVSSQSDRLKALLERAKDSDRPSQAESLFPAAD